MFQVIDLRPKGNLGQTILNFLMQKEALELRKEQQKLDKAEFTLRQEQQEQAVTEARNQAGMQAILAGARQQANPLASVAQAAANANIAGAGAATVAEQTRQRMLTQFGPEAAPGEFAEARQFFEAPAGLTEAFRPRTDLEQKTEGFQMQRLGNAINVFNTGDLDQIVADPDVQSLTAAADLGIMGPVTALMRSLATSKAAGREVDKYWRTQAQSLITSRNLQGQISVATVMKFLQNQSLTEQEIAGLQPLLQDLDLLRTTSQMATAAVALDDSGTKLLLELRNQAIEKDDKDEIVRFNNMAVDRAASQLNMAPTHSAFPLPTIDIGEESVSAITAIFGGGKQLNLNLTPVEVFLAEQIQARGGDIGATLREFQQVPTSEGFQNLSTEQKRAAIAQMREVIPILKELAQQFRRIKPRER